MKRDSHAVVKCAYYASQTHPFVCHPILYYSDGTRGHHFNTRFSKISWLLGGEPLPNPTICVSTLFYPFIWLRCHKTRFSKISWLLKGGAPPKPTSLRVNPFYLTDSQMPPEGTISTTDFQKSLGSWDGTHLPNPYFFLAQMPPEGTIKIPEIQKSLGSS